ncbi:methylglutaconyl-CoA hydratase [Rhodoligotrophos appendicifer]|uniref:enoyl-CoA hydratase-related protein n=1 Tax=Rhodoligotrophos appendicifer TaxID=987056 RepID=UPI001185C1A6|nr:enoyl-CoA hydratase-related protein [Rhodoligotrophos appendicifer]
MEFQTIHVATDERGVATLELNGPSKHNAICETMASELRGAFERFAADGSVRLVLITGRGRTFCAGGDLTWFLQSLDESVEARVMRSQQLGDLFAAMHGLPKPLIGRINGPAFGAGVGLAAVCDVAIGLDRCQFGFPETRIGLIPATFSPYVIRRIGAARARSVMLSGERFEAARAHQFGLLDGVCADEDALDARIEQLVEDHLEASPVAIAMTKELIEHLADHQPDEARRWVAGKVGEIWERGDAPSRIRRLLTKSGMHHE